MFVIRSFETTIVLPSPEWGNSSALAASVQVLRTMDGNAYVYNKDRQDRRKLQWSFIVSRNKAIELRNFIEYYCSSLMIIMDHNGDTYLAYLQNNPFEANNGERAGGFPGDETQQVTLEFEEKI